VELRQYQIDAQQELIAAWKAGVQNQMLVMPTGAGKTVLMADTIRRMGLRTCAIAHRQELVSQISLALAKCGIRHDITAPDPVVKLCVDLHVEHTGKNYHSGGAPVSVAGVDTLIRLPEWRKAWADRVQFWVIDEAHHVQTKNKWGKATALFRNAQYGLGVTATPCRADGRGLSRETDGVFDGLVIGPNMRELTRAGFLTDYRIYAPSSSLDLTGLKTGVNGDFTQRSAADAVKRSDVVGCVVGHYLKHAAGLRGVTFAPSVELSEQLAHDYRAAGVPAESLDGGTPDRKRTSCIRKLAKGELLQLCNVDLFGEGFDLPAISVVSFARPTQSFALYSQQFGRALRPFPGKDHAIIIDHVGNTTRPGFGLPDTLREWSLDRRQKRTASLEGVVPLTSCPECTAAYERIHKGCPECGYIPEPVERSAPEFVDGDLIELSGEALARLRGEVARVNRSSAEVKAELEGRCVPHIGVLAGVKRHEKTQAAQSILLEAMQAWGGQKKAEGQDRSTAQRRFYHTFGVDVLTAQTLKAVDANALTGRILGDK